jgi:hypothetical protein
MRLVEQVKCNRNGSHFLQQTIIYVYWLADAHQICTLNFCKWLYIFFTGLAALYRHWRFLVPGSNPAHSKQPNH